MEKATLEDVVQRFVPSDQRLLRAARTGRLQIFNPEMDSQQTLIDWID